jgi:carbohydrate-selective porin OprB
LYYKCQLTQWCSIAPDLQVILNPGASQDADVVTIVGLRLTVEF